MHDYQRDKVINVDAERLYAYLSDVENLPHYFARMRSAELIDEKEVHTRALVDIPGQGSQEVEGTAWFLRDPVAQQIEWGSEGNNNYHGRLTVSESGERSSRVELEIHTESGQDGIEEAIEQTLATLETSAHADA